MDRTLITGRQICPGAINSRVGRAAKSSRDRSSLTRRIGAVDQQRALYQLKVGHGSVESATRGGRAEGGREVEKQIYMRTAHSNLRPLAFKHSRDISPLMDIYAR